MSANAERSTVLDYSDGRSDKTYRVQLIVEAGGYVVNAQYGRRGGSLNSITKTPTPVPYAKAEKAYQALVDSKLKKGYHIVEDNHSSAEGPVATVTPVAREERVDVPVMLLNPIDEAQAVLLVGDPAWSAELKHDGERRLIVIENGDAYGVNRRGMKVALSAPVRAAVLASPLRGRTVLDGEDMGDTVQVFDVLAFEGQDMTHLSYGERVEYRQCVRARIPGLSYITTVTSSKDKAALIEQAQTTKQEGVVFKRLSAPHTAGRPNRGGDALKLKFVESASVRVAGVHPTKRSVSVEVLDAAGQWIGVGNVSVPTNYGIPAVGAICEVEYLFAHREGSLYQPVYRGERTDLSVEDCTHAQLKFVDERTELAQAA